MVLSPAAETSTDFQMLPEEPTGVSAPLPRSNMDIEDGTMPLPQRNLYLPDIDDLSMNHVFVYMEYYEHDLYWSSLSDSFFIAGGLVYVVLSLWDWIWEDQQQTSFWYYALCGLAPLIYLINSFIGIIWAGSARYRYKVKSSMKHIWQEHKEIALNNSESDETSHEIPWCHRLRKHATHRRTILAALTFGIAACLDVIAVVLRYFVGKDHDVAADGLDMASDHVYILSAVVAITGKRTRPWLSSSSPGCTNMINDSEPLEDMGDLLFLIGSLVDGSMWYWMVQDQPAWSFISSVLWLLDACFYLRSDVVMAERVTSKRNVDRAWLV